MQWLALIIFGLSTISSAENCPQLTGIWAGGCGELNANIFMTQKDCDKFIFNEFEQDGDGSFHPSSRYYTLNNASLYKKPLANGGEEKAYRRAEFDQVANTLILHQTRTTGQVVEVSQTKFKFTEDMSALDYTFENFSLTSDEMLASHSCPGIKRVK
jgi:hypothetical protein